jgi:hypothetical protein
MPDVSSCSDLFFRFLVLVADLVIAATSITDVSARGAAHRGPNTQ